MNSNGVVITAHLNRTVRVALCVALVRCAGTEADNPYTDNVLTGPCKSEVAARSSLQSHASHGVAQSQSHALTTSSQVPLGLHCLGWRVTQEGRLALELANFSGGCAIEWEGGARVTEDGVAIELTNPSCAVAACGNCTYDAEVTVDLPNTPELVVSLDIRSTCDPKDPSRIGNWIVPLASTSEGYLCTYADSWAARSAAEAHGLSGTAYTPCGEGPGAAECGEQLVCAPISDRERRCLPACASHADCGLGGAVRCIEELCRAD